MNRYKARWIAPMVTIMLFLHAASAWGVRIKDIAQIEGARKNQLIGYGLVVGLDGTGDKRGVAFTMQSMANMLERMGLTLSPGAIKVKNVAAVMVTSELPPFAKPGGRIDVLVSSLGDAKSLRGGTLLLTPLKGPDGKIYAVAQGPVSTGSFSAGGAAGGGIQKNFPTVGKVVNGALIERDVRDDFQSRTSLSIFLYNPDFTTATRMANALNQFLGAVLARPVDAGTVIVEKPSGYQGNMVEFTAGIEHVDVKPDVVAKVVLDERTGTVAMGENVRISTIAVSHGNLSIEIKERQGVSQPAPFSEGQTVVVPDTEVSVSEEKAQLIVMEEGVTVGEVVRALNAVAVSPRDLIAIFQAIKAAGALHAKLEII
jgi:flagellar P-ring protein precursor FlgI